MWRRRQLRRPLDGELGDYIGAQMAAVNLQGPAPETPTSTACPTSTVTTPTSTSTLTPTPTATPTPIPCIGDCDVSHSVTVDEVVKGVNIALGTATLDQCRAFDCNGNAQVTVDCLVKAVNAALGGCGIP